MTLGERIFALVFMIASGSALAFMIVGIGLVIVGSPILRRRRTRPIRKREYPAWEHWLAKHYPKATKDEAEIIRRVVSALASDAGAEPAQLLPQDRLAGFVLASDWEQWIGTDVGSELSDEMEALLDERNVDPPERSLGVDEPSDTVGDAVDFMLKRLCPRTSEHAEKLAK